MKITVTGGLGFIGSHVIRRLLKTSDVSSIVCIDCKFRSDDESLALYARRLAEFSLDPKFIFFDDNVVNMGSACTSYIGDSDVVFHFAAITTTNSDLVPAATLWDVNVSGTLSIIESVKEGSTIIFASSAAVYGEAVQGKCTEDQVPNPTSLYGLSKLTSESLLRLSAVKNNVVFTSLRFFNVVGSGQSKSSPYSGVLSRWINDLKKGNRLTIFGDGHQSRDFVSVTYLADMCVHIAFAKDVPEIINVGSGRSISVYELYLMLVRMVEPKLNTNIARDHLTEPVFQPAPLGEIKHSACDTRVLTQVCGRIPETDLQGIISELLETEW